MLRGLTWFVSISCWCLRLRPGHPYRVEHEHHPHCRVRSSDVGQSHPGVTMTNNTGVFGFPYITVSAGSLAPGALASVAIQFMNPLNEFINYTPVSYPGGLL